MSRISRPFQIPLNDETVRLAELLAHDDNFSSPRKKEEARQFRDLVRHVRCQVPCIGEIYRSIYEASCIQAINNAHTALMKKERNRGRKKSSPPSQGGGDRDSDLDHTDGSNDSGQAAKPKGAGGSGSSGNPDAFNSGFTPSSYSGGGTAHGDNTPYDEYDYSSLSSYASDSDDSIYSSGYEAASSGSDYDSDECEDDLDDEDTFYKSEENRRATQMKANRLIMRYLQDPSLDLAEQDESGMTVLHKMCSLGHLYYVGWLLYKGVDPLLKTNDNRTALDIARSIKRCEVIKLLEEAIAFRKDRPNEASPQVANRDKHFRSGVSPERPDEDEEMPPSRCTTGDFSTIDLPPFEESLEPTVIPSQDEMTTTPEAVDERPHVIEDVSLSQNEANDERSDSFSSDDGRGLKCMQATILALTDPNYGRQRSLSSSEDSELGEVPLVTAQLADSLRSPNVLPTQEAVASLVVEEPSEDAFYQYNEQAAVECIDAMDDSHEKSQLVTALERVVSTVVEGMASLQKQQKEWLDSQETFLSRLSRGNSSKNLSIDLPDVRSNVPPGNIDNHNHNHRLIVNNRSKPDPPGRKMEESEEVQNCALVNEESWEEVSAPGSDPDDTCALCFVEIKDEQDQEEDEQKRCLKRDDSWETDSDGFASAICFVKEQDIQAQGQDTTFQETAPTSCLCHAFVLDACDNSQCDNKSTTEGCCFLDEASITSFDGKIPALVVLDETALLESSSSSTSSTSSTSLTTSQPATSKALVKTIIKRTARKLLLRMNSTETHSAETQ